MDKKYKLIKHEVGDTWYETPCIVCGSSVFIWGPNDNVKYKCRECRKKEKEFQKEKSRPLRQLKAERRLEIAVEYLEKRGILDEYTNPLKVVEKHLYKSGWFESSDEILVALELIRNGYKIRHQVKMGRWRVDFVIHEFNVVLEVDGVIFHPKERKQKEKIRDNSIIAYLGPEWEVIRITDKMLEKNIQKLIPAIKGVIKERSRLRKSYNSKLPNWYSDDQI